MDGGEGMQSSRTAPTAPVDEDEKQEEDGGRDSSDGSVVSLDDEFDNDLATLDGYSFVSVTANASVFEMHGPVQLVTKKWLES